MRDYVELTYGKLPFTTYPLKLVEYVIDYYKIKDNSAILDVGCGRGEYIKAFDLCGMRVWGTDQCNVPFIPEVVIRKDDFNVGLTFKPNLFDVTFCKSVLEHLYYPEKLAAEMHRVLKSGGLCIAIVPDWEANMRGFYGDCTHRTPFTKESLAELLEWVGFNDVKCEYFIPTPLFWRKPWLLPFYRIAGVLLPRSENPSIVYGRKRSRMLLASGRK